MAERRSDFDAIIILLFMLGLPAIASRLFPAMNARFGFLTFAAIMAIIGGVIGLAICKIRNRLAPVPKSN